MMKTEKIQKILAQAGVGSRREIEFMLEAGRVSVNGQIAKLGDRALNTDQFRVDGHLLRLAAELKTRVLVYNKPIGQVCTRRDEKGRDTVFDHLPLLRNSRWISVGRLDINTQGLLLFTNNGELANGLMHPKQAVEREYAVRVFGEVPEGLIKTLLAGVVLDDGPAKFISMKDAGGEGMNHWYHVVLTEGRNREVRRMFESLGVQVSRLIRIRYASVTLPRFLQRGRWHELDPAAVKALEKMYT